MTKKRPPLSALRKEAEAALKEAVRGVIQEHHRLGLPLIVWRDGKVCRIPVAKLIKK